MGKSAGERPGAAEEAGRERVSPFWASYPGDRNLDSQGGAQGWGQPGAVQTPAPRQLALSHLHPEENSSRPLLGSLGSPWGQPLGTGEDCRDGGTGEAPRHQPILREVHQVSSKTGRSPKAEVKEHQPCTAASPCAESSSPAPWGSASGGPEGRSRVQLALQDDKQGPGSQWEAQASLGITEPSLERVWENWDCSWARQDDDPGRGAGLAALEPSAAPCRPLEPQQRREQEFGPVAAHRAGFSLENKPRSKPPLR